MTSGIQTVIEITEIEIEVKLFKPGKRPPRKSGQWGILPRATRWLYRKVWALMLPNKRKRLVEFDEGTGARSVYMRMVLLGPRGAVHFVLDTGWMLYSGITDGYNGSREAWPADLGYHSYEPMYDYENYKHKRLPFGCQYLPDAPGGCYYEGTSMGAEPLWIALREKGHAAVWALLEEHYEEVFHAV